MSGNGLEREFSAREYAQHLYDFASARGEWCLDMLLTHPFKFNANRDEFYRTKRGLYRMFCMLDLEFLFCKVLKPNGDWSPAHSLMCKEVQQTNLLCHYNQSKLNKDVGKWDPDIRKKVDKIDRLSMMLMFRGWFKTTLFSVAHSIQEALLDPDIRTLIVSGNLDTAKSILGSIKSHFMMNDKFRYLFPEYCPVPSKTGKLEFGTQEEVTLPNRKAFDVREPSFKAASPTTKLTGYHFKKMVIDDIVDEKNCTNEEQIASAKKMFQMMLSLFDEPSKPWYFFNGTHYHFADLYMDRKRLYADDKGEYEYVCFNPATELLETRKKKVA